MTCIIEKQNVIEIYDKISKSFSITRGYLWKGIKQFINELDINSFILDAGCGNGKNMFRKDCKFIGLDNSKNMIKIAKEKTNNECIIGDIRKLPFNDNLFDAVISVAVIHHIYNKFDRIKCIEEMIRVVKPGGKIFIQVWENMKEKNHKFQKIDNNDYFVSWDNRDGNIYKRYYHLFDKDEFIDLFNKFSTIRIIDIQYEMENWIIIIQKK